MVNLQLGDREIEGWPLILRRNRRHLSLAFNHFTGSGMTEVLQKAPSAIVIILEGIYMIFEDIADLYL